MLTDFDQMELAVLRRSELTAEAEARAAVVEVVGDTTPALRQRVAVALANLSYRIDPSAIGGRTRLASNN